MTNENEIQALIQLLDDDDHEVFKHVHAKLKSLGTEAIPKLEEVWNAELPAVTHDRLEEIIHEIQFDSLTGEWENWLGKESPDLLTGAFLISKFHYPELNFEEIQRKMQKLKQNIWLELNYNQTPLEQIQIFNQVFYSYHGFKGSQTSSEFQDFCLNNVIETKKGNAISIGIVYQILANDLNLPVYGVNLVRHYILAFCKKTILDFSSDENHERDVMFYVNPVNKGSIFSRNEIKDYLDKLTIEHEDKFFVPTDNLTIIKELLTYLIELYALQNRTDNKVKELTYLLEMI